MALFGELEQELRLDKSQFSSELSEAEREMESVDDTAQSTGSRFQSMGEKMKGAGMGLTAGVTAPLAAVGFQSLQTASDVEEMQSKMSVVFGEQTDQIKQWAAEQEEATGISELQWQEYATKLQDSFKPMGFAQDEATDMSKQVTSLATDLASFNNMPMGESLDRLRGGLVGNHENLERFGVMINQQNLGEQLQEMFGKGVDAATEQEKVQARLQMVMEGTSDAQGDAARTSESWANQMRSLKGELREAGAQIGQELMPIMKPLLGAAKDAVKWFSGLSKDMKEMGIVAAGVAAALGPLLLAVGTLVTVLSGPALVAAGAFAVLAGAAFAFRDKLRPLVEAVLPQLKSAINGLIPVLRSTANAIMNRLAPVFRAGFKLIKSVVMTALSAIMTIWNRHGDGVIETLTILKNVAITAIKGLVAVYLPIIRRMINIAQALWDKYGDDVKRVIVTMADIVAATFRKLGPIIHQAVQFITNTWRSIKSVANTTVQTFNQVKNAIQTALNFIQNTIIAPVLNWIRSQWNQHGQQIMAEARTTWNTITGVIGDAVAWIRGKLQPFINWATTKWAKFSSKTSGESNKAWSKIQKIIDKATAAIQAAVGGFIDIVTSAWNRWGDDLIHIIKMAFDAIKGHVEFVIDAISTVIMASLQLLRGDWKGAWETITGFLEDTLNGLLGFIRRWNIRGVIKSAVNGAKRAVENLAGDFKNAGEDLLEAFVQGIKNKTNAVGRAVDNAVQDARDKLPGSDAKEGPLSDLTDAGAALPETVAEGMQSNLRALEGSSTAVAQTANPEMATSGRPGSGGGDVVKIDIHVDGSKSPEATAKAIDRRLSSAGVDSWRS